MVLLCSTLIGNRAWYVLKHPPCNAEEFYQQSKWAQSPEYKFQLFEEQVANHQAEGHVDSCQRRICSVETKPRGKDRKLWLQGCLVRHAKGGWIFPKQKNVPGQAT